MRDLKGVILNSSERTWAWGLVAFGVVALLVQAWIPIVVTGSIFFLLGLAGIVYLAVTDGGLSVPAPVEDSGPKVYLDAGSPILNEEQLNIVKAVVSDRRE